MRETLPPHRKKYMATHITLGDKATWLVGLYEQIRPLYPMISQQKGRSAKRKLKSIMRMIAKEVSISFSFTDDFDFDTKEHLTSATLDRFDEPPDPDSLGWYAKCYATMRALQDEIGNGDYNGAERYLIIAQLDIEDSIIYHVREDLHLFGNVMKERLSELALVDE